MAKRTYGHEFDFDDNGRAIPVSKGGTIRTVEHGKRGSKGAKYDYIDRGAGFRDLKGFLFGKK